MTVIFEEYISTVGDVRVASDHWNDFAHHIPFGTQIVVFILKAFKSTIGEL